MLSEFKLGDLVLFQPTTYVDYDTGIRKVGLIVDLTWVTDYGNVLYHILHGKDIVQRFSTGIHERIDSLGSEI